MITVATPFNRPAQVEKKKIEIKIEITIEKIKMH